MDTRLIREKALACESARFRLLDGRVREDGSGNDKGVNGEREIERKIRRTSNYLSAGRSKLNKRRISTELIRRIGDARRRNFSLLSDESPLSRSSKRYTRGTLRSLERWS